MTARVPGEQWILRGRFPSEKGLSELKAEIEEAATRFLTDVTEQLLEPLDPGQGSETFEVLDVLGLPRPPDPKGRRDTLVLVRTSASGKRLRRFSKLFGMDDVQRDRLIWDVPFIETEGDCIPPAMPSHNPGARGVHVAILGNGSVSAKLEIGSEVRRYDATGPRVERVIDDVDRAHATDVAGFVAARPFGAAHGAIVWSYRIHRAWDMVKALRHIFDMKQVRVVCTATEAEDKDPDDDCDEIRALHAMIRDLSLHPSHPILFVASAGNNTDSTIKSPGSAPEAITVGAYRNGVGSSRGAQGSNKPTLMVEAAQSVQTVRRVCNSGTTSVTAPHLAGCIATWLKVKPTLCHCQVLGVLLRASVVPSGADPVEYGFGIFDADSALAEVRSLPAGCAEETFQPLAAV